MFPQSMFRANILKIIISIFFFFFFFQNYYNDFFRMKLLNFYSSRKICVLHGRVFVCDIKANIRRCSKVSRNYGMIQNAQFIVSKAMSHV